MFVKFFVITFASSNNNNQNIMKPILSRIPANLHAIILSSEGLTEKIQKGIDNYNKTLK